MKRLCVTCVTRWSSRIDAVRALKNRYYDILKTLVSIGLTSKDRKERDEAVGLRKNIENYNFVVCIIIWERILTCLHRVAQQLQAILLISLLRFAYFQQRMVNCNNCVNLGKVLFYLLMP